MLYNSFKDKAKQDASVRATEDRRRQTPRTPAV